jgi:biopolymer transport protein ExbD
MADIAFLLLIFFMVTTIFKLEEGLDVTFPGAVHGEKVPKEKLAHVWVLSASEMTIDDRRVALHEIAAILAAKLQEDPALVIGVNIDEQVPWEVAAQVIEQMKAAHAQNASFTHEVETPR